MASYYGQSSRASPSCWIRLVLLGVLLAAALQGVQCEQEPTESQCRPYIEKALKEQHGSSDEAPSTELEDNPPTDELTDSSVEQTNEDNDSEEATGEIDEDDEESDGGTEEDTKDSAEGETGEESREEGDDKTAEETETGEDDASVEGDTKEEQEEDDTSADGDTKEEEDVSVEGDTKEQEDDNSADGDTKEEEDEDQQSSEQEQSDDDNDEATQEDEEASIEGDTKEEEEDGPSIEGDTTEDGESVADADEEETEEQSGEDNEQNTQEEEGESVEGDTEEQGDEADESQEAGEPGAEEESGEQEDATGEEVSVEGDTQEQDGDTQEDEAEASVEGDTNEVGSVEGDTKEEDDEDKEESVEGDTKEEEDAEGESDTKEEEGSTEGTDEGASIEGDTKEESVEIDGAEDSVEGDTKEDEATEEADDTKEETKEESGEGSEEDDGEEKSQEESTPEEDLTKEVVIPDNLRSREHIIKILRLDEDSVETESVLAKAIESTLKTLKGLYDNAIKPLEMLYKYRDLSNRHFGDPEIFSKPLILFMGPWSGGKSSTINYLLNNEFTPMALRTGAEPSPAYFNILMYGSDEEILDGTQLAADWTFSGLQKFGQGLLDRLRGVRMPSRLLEKVNIVEIPGILEIRKQVQRLFPFNDACQWFIDRADIIFLVYDPAKLDVGPETEAILDQLKGREYQTRIILNKADQVKPEELMRVQGTLIWNISPLMSSMEPPIMYSTSLWSLPYETGAPTRLLLAQERAFLRDLREAIDKRVENKIASARRFAVRVRNHAKMVDCYLTTYYNHKTFFGNRKKISDDIIETPQKYHIYEGLSTLTNISRYDLPDPDVYRDFFKINPLYDFTKLSDTCTYFRGCPINKLDIAIAYDLPELVGKYKKGVEAAKELISKTNS